MKTILIAIAAAIGLTNAFAGERVAAANWKSVQTYDVPTLLKEEGALIGKIVGVRFHYRSEKLRHLQPNWYEASIWRHDPNAKNGYSALRVMVAKNDVPDFKTITFDFNSMSDVLVYGRVEKDPDNNLAHLRLLGRKVTTDDAGNATIDW
jgi:hypothetical protein